MRATLGRNFSVTVGRAPWEACSATWNLGTNSALALRPRKTTENLDHELNLYMLFYVVMLTTFAVI
jgi:hypothetical protein